MKILKIELQNLNSLKSETPLVIDFEQDQFKDVGLYAITGSTGAGKTTILDAITIGLYHQVPRFKRSNIKAGLVDVVSYGASEALSRITFESNQQKFEAQWALRVASKTGKLLKSPVESVRFKNLSTNTILAEKKTEVQQKIFEVTQLTYDQFLRSVMLAQGEFAAFLSANAKDKGKLLEQITGEEIYKKIGNTISERLSEEKKTLEQIKAKINTEDLLTEETKTLLLNEQNALNLQIKTTEKDLQNHKTIQEWYTKQQEFAKQEESLEKERLTLHTLKAQSTLQLEQLNKHEEAVHYQPDIKEIERLEQDFNTCLQAIISTETKVKQLNSTLTEHKANVNTFSKRYLQAEEAFNIWLPKLDEVAKLDVEITHKKASLLDVKQKTEANSTELNTLTDRENSYSKIITDKTEELKQIREQLKQKETIKTYEAFYSEWNTHLTSRKHLLEQLQEAERKVRTLKQTVIQEETQLKSIRKNQSVFSLEIKEKSEALHAVKKSIETVTLDSLMKKHSELEQHVQTWKRILEYFDQSEAHKQTDNQLKSKVNTLRHELNTLQTELKSLSERKSQLEQSVEASQKIVDLTLIVEQYAEERKKLEKDKPCALCGSTIHPYVDAYSVPELSIEKVNLKEKQNALKTVLEQESLLKQNIGITNSKIDTTDLQVKDLQAQQTKIHSELERLYSGKEQLSKDGIITQIETGISNLTDQQKQLKEHQSLLRKKDELEKEYAVLHQKQIDFEQQLAVVNQKITSQQHQLKDTEGLYAKLQKEVSDVEQALNTSFSSVHLQLPTAEKTEYFLSRLKNGIEEYHKLVKAEEELTLLIKTTKHESDLNQEVLKKHHNIQKELITLTKDIENQLTKHTEKRLEYLPESITADQKRTQLNSEKTTYLSHLEQIKTQTSEVEKSWIAKQQELKSFKNQLKGLETSQKEVTHKLNIRLKSSPFTTAKDVQDTILSDEHVNQFKGIKQDIQTKETQLNTREEQIKTGKAALIQQKNFDVSEEDNTKSLQDKSNRVQTFNQQLGAINSKFALDKQITDRNESVVKKIKQQEQVYQKWSQLLSLIGGSKHAFNTYVQRLTLKNLIQLANIHLYKLNKRYSLKMEDTYKPGEELSFKLVDHYQTDITRYVDTSSGGEKFLISLSLALGLSDLSNHNVQIKSLFIDEGFGTLDNSTLEIVLTTLETLQAQGKMIGVISHIDALKNRIPTQIQVIKKSNGVSTLSIS